MKGHDPWRHPDSAPFKEIWHGKWETPAVWEMPGQWEGTGGNWDQLSNDDGTFHEEFDNVLNWDDSGAREALFIAKERYEAGLRGQVYPIPLPSPDMYNQVIDWDTYEAFDLPESVDAGREESKGQRKRGRKFGRFHGNRRGNRRYNHYENIEHRSNGDEDINSRNNPHKQRELEWDFRVPESSGLSNAQPWHALPGPRQGRLSELCMKPQDQANAWHWNSQSQPSHHMWRESYISSDQAGRRTPRHDLNQNSYGMWGGDTSVHRQGYPSTSGNMHSSGWSMAQHQFSGRPHPFQSSLEDWQWSSQPGNLQSEYPGFFNKPKRWGPSKYQLRHNR